MPGKLIPQPNDGTRETASNKRTECSNFNIILGIAGKE
jgi:hypothetical protein